MKKPRSPKNPFLSLWLSGAHTAMNTARGHATAQAQREAGRLVRQATENTFRFWNELWSVPAPPKTRRRKRR